MSNGYNPTPRLRFVTKEKEVYDSGMQARGWTLTSDGSWSGGVSGTVKGVVFTRPTKVLQQLWVSDRQDDLDEWRDVPTEKET